MTKFDQKSTRLTSGSKETIYRAPLMTQKGTILFITATFYYFLSTISNRSLILPKSWPHFSHSCPCFINSFPHFS